jgi:hypothetical protein
MQPGKRLRIDAQDDRKTIKARADRAAVLASAVKAPFVQAHPALLTACQDLIAASDALKTADEAYTVTDAALTAARGARDSKVTAYDAAYDVCIAQVQQCAATPEDVQSMGFGVFSPVSYALVVPPSVQAKYDPVRNVIYVRVERAPGIRACTLEVSQTPADPASWQRLPGLGTSRKLPGYAAGTHWFRAASVRATEQSAFTDPVSVIVK